MVISFPRHSKVRAINLAPDSEGHKAQSQKVTFNTLNTGLEISTTPSSATRLVSVEKYFVLFVVPTLFNNSTYR